MSASLDIEVIPTNHLAEAGYLDLLSDVERDLYWGILNRDRRRKWICGRVVAKHLFLSQLKTQDWGRSCRWPPRLAWIDRTALQEFSCCSYREVQVTAEHHRISGVPAVRWDGFTYPVNLSLSHTSELSGAYIDFYRSVGLDLEVPLPRNHAFYRVSFSREEHRWVQLLTETGQISIHVLYTLLWCLKESVLKSQQSDEISVWQVPRIELELQCEPNSLISALRSARLDGPMFQSVLDIRTSGQTQIAEAAVAVSQSAVLTAVRLS